MPTVESQLEQRGIQPSAQRVAVGRYVLATGDHPTAEQVLARVRAKFPMISRATVYNTLNLFVRAGLLREYSLGRGPAVFDAHTADHHHFIDDDTGAVSDVAWDAVRLSSVRPPKGYSVRDFHVVLRGKRTLRRSRQS